MFIQHFLLGLFLLAAGVVSLKFNYQLVGITGSISWVEKYLGGGSTYFFFKMLSIIACIVGSLYMTGLATPFFDWLLSPLAVFFPHPAN